MYYLSSIQTMLTSIFHEASILQVLNVLILAKKKATNVLIWHQNIFTVILVFVMLPFANDVAANNALQPIIDLSN